MFPATNRTNDGAVGREQIVSERGIALVTAMLTMMLMSAVAVGFTAVVMSDQRFRGIDRDRNQAFYAAHSGLEKLTVDLASLFFVNVAPTDEQLQGLTETAPDIPGVSFTAADGSPGFVLRQGSPAATTIQSGPYQGLMALKTAYELHATARTGAGGEVHLTRHLETVAIPVFQFGFFSEVDLSFSAADNFDFGGRVHSNRNVFLAQGGGATDKLVLRDKVTAVGEVVRQRLSNGRSIDDSNSTRTVSMARSTNAFRDLARTEGSVSDGVGSPLNDPLWSNVSLSEYNGYIRNGRTGAKALNLPLITVGGTNADLVLRPAINEDIDNATLFGQRYFSQVSLRILLSDTAEDITDLPTVTDVAPVNLDGNWNTTVPNNGVAYGPIDATHPPVARTPPLITVNTSGGSVNSGTNRTITVASVPTYFRPPASMSVLNGTTVTAATISGCTGRTATTFTGCTVAGASIPSGRTVSAVVDSATVTATTSGSTVSTGSGRTITVDSTAAFAPQTFWVNNNLVTCSGTTTTTFTGCAVPMTISSGSTITTAAAFSATTATDLTSPVGGFIKIERQDPDGVWHDVTMEMLNWGIAGPSLGSNNPGNCTDPNPNAIIRLQRLRDNGGSGGPVCNNTASLKGTDYWPNTLFDPREGTSRDKDVVDYEDEFGSALPLGGVIHYVAIDAANLAEWFAGDPPYDGGTGSDSIQDNGFSVYFSDRRNNRNLSHEETGEYGYEDVINPDDDEGDPNGDLDAGEDMNENEELDDYGRFPSYGGLAQTVPPGALAPLDAGARPTTLVGQAHAKVSRAILFRRALKLTNGANLAAILGDSGLTVATENPIYLQGDWNANASSDGFDDPHVPTSIVGDAIIMLSNAWNDNKSFSSPYDIAGRARSANTWYRVAIIAGKGPIFANPAGTGATFGTDGGAHSFLRFLEGNGPNPNTIHYLGSLATFFYHRQAIGAFRCCGALVYGVPARDYKFDTDFLDPSKLPPLTPVFRDLNTLGFSQEIRPGR